MEAQAALKDIMLTKEFGSAGDQVVIEEYLEGEELSFLTFSDGFTLRSLPPAQVCDLSFERLTFLFVLFLSCKKSGLSL